MDDADSVTSFLKETMERQAQDLSLVLDHLIRMMQLMGQTHDYLRGGLGRNSEIGNLLQTIAGKQQQILAGIEALLRVQGNLETMAEQQERDLAIIALALSETRSQP
jgi:hypothetical protein